MKFLEVNAKRMFIGTQMSIAYLNEELNTNYLALPHLTETGIFMLNEVQAILLEIVIVTRNILGNMLQYGPIHIRNIG